MHWWPRQTPRIGNRPANRLIASFEMPASAGVQGPGDTMIRSGFIASISSCHMLWFLHLACQAKFAVDRYLDEATGVLERNAEGRMAMTRVTLRPAVTFAGRQPSAEEHAQLHERAHDMCFVANSVKSEVLIEPRIV